ncbi:MULTISPECIES: hypothetical protein, partial [unclassified Arsukibacterium]|uniref:hypothetical protein n=1 Tax=unclassified Arsukibacterium TaxID=2635278 RepID=UPI000E8D31FF
KIGLPLTTIQFGAWEIHLTHGSAKVTELTYQPNRFKLSKEAQHVYASLDESILKVVREVVEKRPKIIRYLPTYKTLAI